MPGGLPPYDRGDWDHWTDEDGDCRNTRHEVLVAESQTPVTYREERGCRVGTRLSPTPAASTSITLFRWRTPTDPGAGPGRQSAGSSMRTASTTLTI